MNPSEVLPRLLVGSCPAGADDIERLQTAHGVTAILSLQTDDDLEERQLDWNRIEADCRRQAIVARRIPVERFDVEDGLATLSHCVVALDELLREGRTVYLHCNLGTVRSPGVVVAYLVWRQGWKLSEAIDYVRDRHPCSPDVGAILLVGSGRMAA
jgi:protein-tyrosine phosphatase